VRLTVWVAALLYEDLQEGGGGQGRAWAGGQVQESSSTCRSAFTHNPNSSSVVQLGLRYTVTTLNKLPPPQITEDHFREKVGRANGCGGCSS